MSCIRPGCDRETTPFTHPACSDAHYEEALAAGQIVFRRVKEGGPVDLVSGLPMESDAELRERILKGRP